MTNFSYEAQPALFSLNLSIVYVTEMTIINSFNERQAVRVCVFAHMLTLLTCQSKLGARRDRAGQRREPRVRARFSHRSRVASQLGTGRSLLPPLRSMRIWGSQR